MTEMAGAPPTLDDLRARRAEILRIAAARGVTNVRVFGSLARGDAAAASDVDLVVDLPSDARGFHSFGILDELQTAFEALIGRPVHVVTLREPFSPRGAEIARRIQQEARVL